MPKEGHRVLDDEWQRMMRAMNNAATVTLLLHTIRGIKMMHQSHFCAPFNINKDSADKPESESQVRIELYVNLQKSKPGGVRKL